MPNCKEKDCIHCNDIGECEFLHKKGESRIQYNGKTEKRACAWYDNNSGKKCDDCKNAVNVDGHVQKYCTLKLRVLPLGRVGCEYFKT